MESELWIVPAFIGFLLLCVAETKAERRRAETDAVGIELDNLIAKVSSTLDEIFTLLREQRHVFYSEQTSLAIANLEAMADTIRQEVNACTEIGKKSLLDKEGDSVVDQLNRIRFSELLPSAKEHPDLLLLISDLRERGEAYSAFALAHGMTVNGESTYHALEILLGPLWGYKAPSVEHSADIPANELMPGSLGIPTPAPM